jgi:hypothetical protein
MVSKNVINLRSLWVPMLEKALIKEHYKTYQEFGRECKFEEMLG